MHITIKPDQLEYLMFQHSLLMKAIKRCRKLGLPFLLYIDLKVNQALC